jgi:cell division protein FtsQ
MKKIKKILPWLLMPVYIIVVLVFTGAKSKDVKVDKITVVVRNQDVNRFVTDKDIIRILKNDNLQIKGARLDSLNIYRIEEALVHHPSIKHANVYRNPNGEIGVKIDQRMPVLRVINSNHESYYIEAEGTVMPLSTRYTAHVIVANGNINESYSNHVGENLKRKIQKNYASTGEVLPDLYQLVKYINDDHFWRSQIEQIYINQKGEFELIPRVGNHVIVFGKTDDMDKKFENLEAFYEQGLNKEGWNKYRTINVKYNNQVICTKR